MSKVPPAELEPLKGSIERVARTALRSGRPEGVRV
jgi:hypothetical protein